MGQILSIFVSWVDIHGIYYIVKRMETKYDDVCSSWNIPFLTRTIQNWTKQNTTKMQMKKNSKNIYIKILSMVIYM